MSLTSGNSSTSSMSSTSSTNSSSSNASIAARNGKRKRTHSVNRPPLQPLQVASVHMTAFCFDVVFASLRNAPAPKVPPCIPNDKYPLFVTWKKGYERRLRGCIGTFSNLVLHKGLHEYAIISAFKDSRFDPIALHEVEHLHCAVSILLDFEKARDYRDWVVGLHGIRIEFQDRHNYRDAVYLPEVARWDHAETLDNLMRKGGFRGHISEDMRLKVTVVRFRSDKVHMSYPEYVAYKANSGEFVANGDANNARRGLFHSCRP